MYDHVWGAAGLFISQETRRRVRTRAQPPLGMNPMTLPSSSTYPVPFETAAAPAAYPLKPRAEYFDYVEYLATLKLRAEDFAYVDDLATEEAYTPILI